MCEGGRTLHREWVEDMFGTELPLEPIERDRIIDALVVATDVYSWKLLRRDRRLTVAEVRDRMLLMIDGVLTVSQGANARAAP